MPVPRALATVALVLLMVTSAACAAASVAPGSAGPPAGAAASTPASPSPQASLAEASPMPTVEPTRSPGADVPASPTVSASPTAVASPGAPSTPSAAPSSAATVRPTVAPTVKPTAAPTPKPTAKPTATPTAKPTTAPARLAVEARDFLFVPSALSTRAGAPFQIAFTNADAAIPHNVTIGGGGSLAFNGKLVTGPSSTTYAVPALAAGDYVLGCIVHPAMTGTLTVR